MAILGHHGRRISLRVLFHAPAGPSLGTGTRRCLSAIAFPVIGIRLFRPASPPRPLSGLPAVRAGVRGVSSSRLLESHARPGPSARGPAQSRERTAPGATPASRAATLRAQDRDFRGNGSSGLGCAPRRLTATTAAWPATRWAQSETPRLFPPPCRCRRQGLAARPVPLLAVWSAVRRFPRHRGFHNPGDRCPGPSPSHSPSPLSTDLLVWCSSRHRHRPATGPADSQEHAGDLDLGDGALGQVSVLPADLSALGGLAQPRPGPVVGHPDRRPEADGAAVGAGVRGLGEAEPRAEAVARRRDAVASLRHARREGRLPVVSLGLSFPRGRDLHPGGRAVARRA